MSNKMTMKKGELALFIESWFKATSRERKPVLYRCLLKLILETLLLIFILVTMTACKAREGTQVDCPNDKKVKNYDPVKRVSNKKHKIS